MSWAAGRQTSRVEDVAYSLLGLFDINMPLLYGEGDKAFLRLQEEVIKVSTDQSIFAWEYMSPDYDYSPHQNWVSLLAPNSMCFKRCGSVTIARESFDSARSSASEIYAMTNVGLSIQLPLVATTTPRLFYAALRCSDGNYAGELWVPLLKVDGTFTRRAWPPMPLPQYFSLRHLAPPRQIVIPRFERHGQRADVWEKPEFVGKSDKHILLQIVLSLSLDGYQLYEWTTTDRVSLHLECGILEVHDVGYDKNFEGAQLLFVNTAAKRTLTVLAGVDAKVQDDTLRMRFFAWTSDFDGPRFTMVNATPRMWFQGPLDDFFKNLDRNNANPDRVPWALGKLVDWVKTNCFDTDAGVKFTKFKATNGLLKLSMESFVAIFSVD
ncbi:hypothetical protein B0T18DRAFT_397521 [Schizothecium vesticola]|uniref:DUF8212 domain-containing protein n=1 Tax=Schizothecium vesticola TaxID=314040 RepID=A0AA40F9H2_9PEZI|nr:hypothetical protein B0T18DRAFT_397521 [Schizothecium vesticola]